MNTLQPYRENPPDRVLGPDDIAFCDFGPVLEQWEADFGRTYMLGQDPVKIRLRDTLPVIFDAGREYFESHPEISGEQLYAHMVRLAADAGWTFGGSIAGHLVGQFPHEKIADLGHAPAALPPRPDGPTAAGRWARLTTAPAVGP